MGFAARRRLFTLTNLRCWLFGLSLSVISASSASASDPSAYVGNWAYEDGACDDMLSIGENHVEDNYDLYCTWDNVEYLDDRGFAIVADCGAEPSMGTTTTSFTFQVSADGKRLTWMGGPDFGSGPVSSWTRCQ